MEDGNLYKDAFIELMSYIRELADEEKTDLESEYSRGRASGIHAVLLAIDTVVQAADINRSDVGLSGFDAVSWYER
jgi:hypothetical protein